ncbi:MAG: DNA/RNA non-specific endonuclease [Prevotella sp.]|nr:DNA/RNA non-specific endonuclease [Prevotella sp.]
MKQSKQTMRKGSSWGFLLAVMVVIVLCVAVLTMLNKPARAAVTPSEEALLTEESATKSSKTKALKGLEIPAMTGKRGQVLLRKGYTTCYNSEYRLPFWTAWRLTAAHTTGPYKRGGMSFSEDEEVPFPRATNSDYMRSGYDRGHMCPSGDNKWDRKAQQDCFLFTNMCPQSHNLNGGDWNDLEMACRRWAKKYGEVYIVCGPMVDAKHRTIGRNRVAVPYAFYKVVLRMSPSPRAIGFVYENEDGHRPMSDYVLTVDEVERLTAIDFFPSLPDNIERRVEAQASLSEW